VKLYSALDTPALNGTTQTPIRDLTGRITGYSTNGTGISTPLYGASPVKPTRAKPQQNSEGKWIDTSTGMPYHGTYTDESGRTQYYSNGQQVSNAADVGIQQQPFSVERTPKNPTISGAIDQLQSEIPNTGLMSKSFQNYLSEASRVNADAKGQLAKDQAAYDTTSTENRLNNDVASQSDALLANNRNYELGQNQVLNDVGAATRNYTGDLTTSLAGLEKGTALTADQLRKNNADYAANQNNVQADVANQTRDYTAGEQSRINDLNQRAATTDANMRANNAQYSTQQHNVQGEIAGQNQTYSTTVADRLNKLKSDLDTQNAQYEKASQAVADQAYGAAQKRNDLYQLTSGTPTSGSGNLDNRYIKAYQDINIPLQQQLADRRYQQVNQLDAAHAGADAQNYQNLMSQYAGESALNSDLSNRGMSLEQYLSSLYGQNYNANENAGHNIYGANLSVDAGASALNSDLANRSTSLDQYLQSLGTQNYGAETSTAGAVNNARLGLASTTAGMNTDFANRNADTTKYLATTDAQTASQIQALRVQTAGMSRAAAASYLQQLAVPTQMAQQVLGNDIANQSAVQGLDERANAYTFNTPYDASRVPASPGFSAVAPRSYTATSGVNNGPVSGNLNSLPSGYTDTASSGQVGAAGANGWVQGSDGNYYVPDATQKTGYRLVWQKPATLGGPYNGNTYNVGGRTYNYGEPDSGSGVIDYGVRA